MPKNNETKQKAQDITSIIKHLEEKLELTEEKNGVYTAKGEVIRIANSEETAYDITLTFQINQNYTYQKYQIISLKSANKSFYPDNTVHLIENTPVE